LAPSLPLKKLPSGRFKKNKTYFLLSSLARSTKELACHSNPTPQKMETSSNVASTRASFQKPIYYNITIYKLQKTIHYNIKNYRLQVAFYNFTSFTRLTTEQMPAIVNVLKRIRLSSFPTAICFFMFIFVAETFPEIPRSDSERRGILFYVHTYVHMYVYQEGTPK
jgi:hypothetical protein